MGPPRVRVGRCLAALRHEEWRTVYVTRLNTEFLVYVRLPLHAPLCTPQVTRILKES
jgi:RecB family endonuclease NucS